MFCVLVATDVPTDMRVVVPIDMRVAVLRHFCQGFCLAGHVCYTYAALFINNPVPWDVQSQGAVS